MSPNIAAIEIEALKLSAEERLLLADHLLASIDPDQEIDAAWAAEIDKRLAEIETGRVQLIPLEQAMLHAKQGLS